MNNKQRAWLILSALSAIVTLLSIVSRDFLGMVAHALVIIGLALGVIMFVIFFVFIVVVIYDNLG